ncbi:MAG: LysR family transcriptional regulator [Betaproteobacteria bacterium]|nr:LysR family transcriptional regulator [Betaproteobacteria bacterium]
MGHVVALADACHFGLAAEQCHLSQPAFSRSILAAEDERGLLLFNRGTAGDLHRCRSLRGGAMPCKLLFDSRCLSATCRCTASAKSATLPLVSALPGGNRSQSLLCDLRTHYAGHPYLRGCEQSPVPDRAFAQRDVGFFIASLAFVPTDPDLVIARWASCMRSSMCGGIIRCAGRRCRWPHCCPMGWRRWDGAAHSAGAGPAGGAGQRRGLPDGGDV